MKTKYLIGGAIGLVVIALVFLAFNKPNADLTTREVALSCTTDMATQFHIHPVLEIFVNGEQQTIPANIGVKVSCMNALHTHTPDGVIHVESPVERDFTLGDFFAVWDKPFSKDQIFDFRADATHSITVTVNGTEVDTYENTILYDRDQVVINYEENAAAGDSATLTGSVTLGPTCPVERIPPDPACAPKAYQTNIEVRRPGETAIVASTRTDEKGTFKFTLPPGTYQVEAKGGNPFPNCSGSTIVLTKGAFKSIELSCDTGIR